MPKWSDAERIPHRDNRCSSTDGIRGILGQARFDSVFNRTGQLRCMPQALKFRDMDALWNGDILRASVGDPSTFFRRIT